MVDIAGIGTPSISNQEPMTMETETEGVAISTSTADEGEVVMIMPMVGGIVGDGNANGRGSRGGDGNVNGRRRGFDGNGRGEKW